MDKTNSKDCEDNFFIHDIMFIILVMLMTMIIYLC